MRAPQLLLTALALWAPACSVGPGPYQPAVERARDPTQAADLTALAAARMEDDPAEAERLLRRALTADLFHGPAHNNLGIVFLEQGRLYEAAGEFEWARKLMPGHPDPRVNLALTLEQAGRADEAIDAYRAALEVQPGYLPAILGLTRAQVRAGRTDAETQSNLRAITFRAEEPDWRRWAERELLKVDGRSGNQ